MALHFTRDEFAARQRRAREEIGMAGLDGLADLPPGEHVLPDRL